MQQVNIVNISIDELENLIESVLVKHLQNFSTSNTSKNNMTISEAASFLDLSITTLYRKVSSRQIPFFKQGKRLYFSESDLNDYLKQGKKMTLKEIQNDVLVNHRK